MSHDFTVEELTPQPAISIRAAVPNDLIGKTMGELFAELMAFAARKGVQLSGPPFAMYHSWDDHKTDMEVGFPLPLEIGGEGRVRGTVIPGGRALVGHHVGPYERLVESYGKMQAWAGMRGLRLAPRMWEVYLTDPQQEKDPGKYVTKLFWPLEE